MNENILTWNVTNWVTVGLMTGILFLGLGFIQKYVQSKVASSGGS